MRKQGNEVRTNAIYKADTAQTVSLSPSTPKRAPKAVDTRSPATMVELLIWAYAKQRVRDARASDVASGPIPSSWSTTGIVCRDLSCGAVIRGSGGAYVPVAHSDAHVIDDFVRRLPGDERGLVIRHAEARSAPEWSPCVPTLVAVPVLRGQWTLDTFRDGNGHAKAGAVRTIAGKRDKPVACLINFEGYPRERAEAAHSYARAVYEAWHCAVRILWSAMVAEDCLARWCITGVGAEREPWQARKGVVL
jgi:hypothetical protein